MLNHTLDGLNSNDKSLWAHGTPFAPRRLRHENLLPWRWTFLLIGGSSCQKQHIFLPGRYLDRHV